MEQKRNNNYGKVAEWLGKNFPGKQISALCDKFGYPERVKGLLVLEEDFFRDVMPEEYADIIGKMDRVRADNRDPYSAAKDIAANFLMEDVLMTVANESFPEVEIRLGDKETRDIEGKASSSPDFIYRNSDTGSEIRFDLKTDWRGKSLRDREFFFRGREVEEYSKYGALALIWCPDHRKFTFVDFRNEVGGHKGTDSNKGNKPGFWADLSANRFGDIVVSEGGTYLDDMLKRLERLASKKPE